MKTYRFIGTEAEIGGQRLNQFGQSVLLTEEDFKDAILGAGLDQGYAGASALIPDEEFQKLGVNPEELRAYGFAGRRLRMSLEFQAKFELAQQVLTGLRAAYETTADDGGEN